MFFVKLDTHLINLIINARKWKKNAYISFALFVNNNMD